MREIKFRVFYKPSNKTYDVLAIDFIKRNVTIEYEKGKSQVVSLDFCELMQYTGLKDRNRVEIYEGNILNDTLKRLEAKSRSIHLNCGYIFFNNGCFFFNFKGSLISLDTLYYHDDVFLVSDFLEVVGNIYENSELLNKA